MFFIQIFNLYKSDNQINLEKPTAYHGLPTYTGTCDISLHLHPVTLITFKNMIMKDLNLITGEDLKKLATELYQLSKKEAEENNQEDILNAKQAAKLLDLSPATIYGKTHRNEIPFFKQGKKLLFSRAALIRLAKERRKSIANPFFTRQNLKQPNIYIKIDDSNPLIKQIMNTMKNIIKL